MAITEKITIDHINTSDMKVLQIIGTNHITEDGNSSSSEFAFALEPDKTPSDIVAYKKLEGDEKTKVDELITELWTDEVKASWVTFQAEQEALNNPE